MATSPTAVMKWPAKGGHCKNLAGVTPHGFQAADTGKRRTDTGNEAQGEAVYQTPPEDDCGGQKSASSFSATAHACKSSTRR